MRSWKCQAIAEQEGEEEVVVEEEVNTSHRKKEWVLEISGANSKTT
jgi:hypothetical protein